MQYRPMFELATSLVLPAISTLILVMAIFAKSLHSRVFWAVICVAALFVLSILSILSTTWKTVKDGFDSTTNTDTDTEAEAKADVDSEATDIDQDRSGLAKFLAAKNINEFNEEEEEEEEEIDIADIEDVAPAPTQPNQQQHVRKTHMPKGDGISDAWVARSNKIWQRRLENFNNRGKHNPMDEYTTKFVRDPQEFLADESVAGSGLRDYLDDGIVWQSEEINNCASSFQPAQNA